jgi:hypothetical protein
MLCLIENFPTLLYCDLIHRHSVPRRPAWKDAKAGISYQSRNRRWVNLDNSPGSWYLGSSNDLLSQRYCQRTPEIPACAADVERHDGPAGEVREGAVRESESPRVRKSTLFCIFLKPTCTFLPFIVVSKPKFDAYCQLYLCEHLRRLS